MIQQDIEQIKPQFEIVPVEYVAHPVVIPAWVHGAISGVLMLIICGAVLVYVLSHLDSQASAVAWAFVCAAVFALARRYA